MSFEWEPQQLALILSHSCALSWIGPDLEEIAWSSAVLHDKDPTTKKLLGELRDQVRSEKPFAHLSWRGTERIYECSGVLARGGTLVISHGISHVHRSTPPVTAVVVNDLLWVIPPDNTVLALAVHLRVREWLCRRGLHCLEQDPCFWVFNLHDPSIDFCHGDF